MPIRWFVAGLMPSAFTVLLVIVRASYGNGWPWLLANVVLVLAPLCFAAATTPRRWWLVPLWLAFFPNAPYVVSDVIHYAARPGLPLWFDAALLGSLAASGLFAGAISARWVLHCVFGERPAWMRVVAWAALAVASGRAIEVGRVHRLNSWDLVIHPVDAIAQLLAPFGDPLAHADAWALTLAYAALVFTWGLALELLVAPTASRAPAMA